MPVPTYDQFIEPILRFLATKPDGVPAKDAHEAAAHRLQLRLLATGTLTQQLFKVRRLNFRSATQHVSRQRPPLAQQLV